MIKSTVQGWDKIRDQRFEKQKELGFWPSNMTDPGRLPPNAGVGQPYQ